MINISKINDNTVIDKIIKNKETYVNKTIINNKINYMNDIEKYIFDCIAFHNNNNLNNIMIEYYIKNNNNYSSLTTLKNNNKLLLSIIVCLDDINGLLLNVSFDEYKYKLFNNKNNVLYIKSLKYSHINLKEEYYTDINNLFVINIYESKHNEINDYNSIYNFDNIEYNYKIINVTSNIINFELYEELIYGIHHGSYFKIKDVINASLSNINENIVLLNIIKDETYEKNENKKKLLQKYGKVIDDIYEINNNKININNRFLQRLIIRNYYKSDICNWFCKEMEKHNKNIDFMKPLYNNSINYIMLEKMPTLFSFMLGTIEKFIVEIRDYYKIDNSININIKELSIVKYNYNISKNYSDIKKTDTSFIFYLLLTDTNTFEGGNIKFNDETTDNLNQGDIIVTCGKLEHCITPLKKGIRYMLLGLLDISII